MITIIMMIIIVKHILNIDDKHDNHRDPDGDVQAAHAPPPPGLLLRPGLQLNM